MYIKPKQDFKPLNKGDNSVYSHPFLRRPYLEQLDGPIHRARENASDDPLQQDFTSLPFFDAITHGGLDFAYAKFNNLPPDPHFQKQTKHPKHVVLVGAGLSALSASYELAQAGHRVSILELQNRVGGRVYTMREQFTHGLHGEAGAMRVPYSQYVTKHYIDLFNIPTRPFQNKNTKGFLYLYGTKITLAEWEQDQQKYSDQFFPGWDKNLTPEAKLELEINGILSLYERTVNPVKQELIDDHSADGWERWVKKWSVISVFELLKSDIFQDPTAKHKLRPWPMEAIEGYRITHLLPVLDLCLIQVLEAELSLRWQDPLFTPVEGMDSLPKAFIKKNTPGWNPNVFLSRNIRFGVKVNKIEKLTNSDNETVVKVHGVNVWTGEAVTVDGDAVIVTLPPLMLRQIDIPLTVEKQKALINFRSIASVRVFLQTRTRFWQKNGLQGGHTKTDLPFGQLYYPDYEGSGIPVEAPGLLLCYVWRQDALFFGSKTPEQAVASVVQQVSQVHPEILDEFEVGTIHDWSRDPSAEGGHTFLHPAQYNENITALLKSDHPIYLAGEALSAVNGWIQGAIESGLRTAYEFYKQNEDKSSKRTGALQDFKPFYKGDNSLYSPFLRRPYLEQLDGSMQRARANASDDPQQQDLTSQPFFNQIIYGGLDNAYAECKSLPGDHFRKQTKHLKHVVLVGAGLSALSAAYELAQAGHQVSILELQNRVGGRAYTIRDKFTHGLHAEAGAMRLPFSHYLTKHYIHLFNIPTRPFQNKNTKSFLYIYDTKITLEEWERDQPKYSDQFFPGWDKNLTPEAKSELKIKGIQSLYEETVAPIKKELMDDHSAEGWERWVKKWSSISLFELLESDIHQDSCAKHKLRPWPMQAIEGYKVSNYLPPLDISLVEILREEFGMWWQDPLYTPEEGMDALPKAFIQKNTLGWNSNVFLSRNIRFGVRVKKIEKVTNSDNETVVKVHGVNESTGEAVTVDGDAVIVTLPLTILRQIDIPLTIEKQKALNSFRYEAATKVFLQTRTRFWQKDGLQGGFTKTNLPFGQLHYPDYEGSDIPVEDRGVLMCYTWGQDALVLGSQTQEEAVASVVQQVSKVHPEILDEFEVGTMHAWFSDPSAEGAFAMLDPTQYNENMKTLMTSENPIYLAGEALSSSNGWIQGAIESGLRTAYEFYEQNEEKFPKPTGVPQE